jgi:hypothetical protein
MRVGKRFHQVGLRVFDVRLGLTSKLRAVLRYRLTETGFAQNESEQACAFAIVVRR